MNITNGKIQLSLMPDGRFTLSCGSIILKNFRPGVTVNDIAVSAPVKVSEQGESIFLTCNADTLRWTLEIAPCQTQGGSCGIALEMNVELAAPVRSFSLFPFAGGNGQINHLQGSGRAGGRAEAIVFPAAERKFSIFYTAMLSNGEDHLFCAVPLKSEALPEFQGKCGDILSDFSLCFTFLHENRVHASSGKILLLNSDDPFYMMQEYAKMQNSSNRAFPSSPVCGWNSWDYYRWTVTEEDVLANADFIAHDPILSKRIKRIIIDDGWQYCYGEWEANPLFPHGMKYLADELTRMGFEPGLWLAPILAEPQSRIAQKSTDWLAMSEGGQPCLAFECMKRNAFILDPTVPQVQEWISTLFDRYASMGYRYFKLDFLQRVLNARRFHDPATARADLQRRIVKAAAHGVNGRAELLGCNYLFAGGNDFIDQVRIGADIHARWDHISQNAVSVAANWHFNRILWQNDPDFALARTICNRKDPELNQLLPFAVYTNAEDQWSADKDRRLVTMEPQQAEVLLSLILISGGVCNFSDNLPLLAKEELAMLYKVLEAAPGDAGCPLDLFTAEIPSIWYQSSQNEERLLFVNWTDEPVSKAFAPATFGISGQIIRDFWSGEVLSPTTNTLAIAPRSCRLLIFPHN